MNPFSKIISVVAVILASFASAIIASLSVPLYFINYHAGQVMHRLFGKSWLFFLGIKVTLHGEENLPKRGEGAVLAPNHESMIDIPLLCSLPVDFRWVSKEQVGKIPFIGASMRGMGCYFVRRDKSGHDLNVMREVEDGLHEGNAVLIFPEGTRTRTGSLLPFKKGAFRAAQNSGVPLVPVAISGTYEIAKPGKWPTWGHHVTVRVGKPYLVTRNVEIPQAMEDYRKEIIKLLSEDRGPGYDIKPIA